MGSSLVRAVPEAAQQAASTFAAPVRRDATTRQRYYKKTREVKGFREKPLPLPMYVVLTSTTRIISCRVPRRKRSTSCDPWRGGKPARGGHWQFACADGSHACYFSFCCEAGMFFSFSYAVINCFCIYAFGLQIYNYLSNFARRPRIFYSAKRFDCSEMSS